MRKQDKRVRALPISIQNMELRLRNEEKLDDGREEEDDESRSSKDTKHGVEAN